MGAGTNIIDDFYGKVRAFVTLTVASLPEMPKMCECGCREFVLTELLYERTSELVSKEDGTIIGYTDGISDFNDTSAVQLALCIGCDNAYNPSNIIGDVDWT